MSRALTRLYTRSHASINRLRCCSKLSHRSLHSSSSLCNKKRLDPIYVPEAVIQGLSGKSSIDPSKLAAKKLYNDSQYDSNYDLKGGVIIERICKILPRPEQWEFDYEEYSQKKASLLEPQLPGYLQDETPQPQYSLVETETQEDRENNIKSLNRALTKSLFLIVKKDRAENSWQFPQGHYEAEIDKLSIKSTAARELREECGEKLNAYILGTAPVGHVQYNYPQTINNKQGAKVFFYHAIYLGGEVNIDNIEITDFAW
jgi:hypothetical protein